jgi:sulfite oxidase
MEQRIWVSFRDGVYDITDFIKVHPGGSEKILLGAGSNLEPFFAFYPFHRKDHV